MNGLVALVSSKEDAIAMQYIYKLHIVGNRARELGRDAHKRMKKGDFTNTPKISDKIIEKIIDKEIKNIKGYDINAE